MPTSSRQAGRQRTEDNEDSTLKEDRFTPLQKYDRRELIRDIPDDITIYEFCTKLDWSTIRTLLAVNFAWQQAVRNHELFKARVRSHLTDKLVVINHALSNGTYGIALYSLREKAFFLLPAIPNVRTGIPDSCQCITMDGKIFILGGLDNPTTQLWSKDVYMLDVAGQRHWKKCASMQNPRSSFGCATLGGKIYVCGGTSGFAPVRVTEAYDPEADAWTTLSPMRFGWICHEVGVVNDELMVYGGRIASEQFRHPQAIAGTHISSTRRANHVQVYNPVQDQWRSVHQASGRYSMKCVFEKLFIANGRLHCINRYEIFVYDIERDSRTLLHTVSRASSLGPYVGIFPPEPILAVDDDLLAIEFRPHWPAVEGGEGPDASFVLLHCKGLGSDESEIVWERAQCPLSFEGVGSPFIRLLQL